MIVSLMNIRWWFYVMLMIATVDSFAVNIIYMYTIGNFYIMVARQGYGHVSRLEWNIAHACNFIIVCLLILLKQQKSFLYLSLKSWQSDPSIP